MKSSEILDEILEMENRLLWREFIAPVAGGRKVRARIENICLECVLQAPFSGWGVFEIHGPGKARLMREAEVWEKEAYLSAFPKASLVLFQRDAGGIWWAQDLRFRRFVPVYLVEGHLPFDVICASFDGVNYWHVSADPGGNPTKAQALRQAFESETDPSFPMTGRERDLYETALLLKRRNAETRRDASGRRIEEALRLGNGKLLESVQMNDGYRVRWKRGNTVVTSVVGADLSVISAGFCLSGRDKEQDLTSLASLLATRPAMSSYEGPY